MSSIMGGSKQSSQSNSSNRAFDGLNAAFSPVFGQTENASNLIMQLLGGDSAGFDSYKRATGFDALTERGSRGILGAGAARGLLRSGSTGMALQDYGQTTQNQFAGDYINRLMGLGGLGIQAGQVVGGAGNVSNSTSQGKQKDGLAKILGAAAGTVAASDERLKKNIIPVGKNRDGLTVYQYRYLDGSGPYYGVMAQEVKIKKPEALGPTTADGFMSVDYSKIGEVV